MPPFPFSDFIANRSAWSGNWVVSWNAPHSRIDALFLVKRTAFIIEERIPEFFLKIQRVNLQLQPGPLNVQYSMDRGEASLIVCCGSVRDAIPEIERCIGRLNPEGFEWNDISSCVSAQTCRVAILVPQTLTDKRWRSSGIPPAPLILAADCLEKGHAVQVVPFEITGSPLHFVGDPDVIAVSVYEDMFESVRDALAGLNKKFPAWIVVGGPMAILAPDALAAHLPEADFILRGEVDEVFGNFVSCIGKPPKLKKLTVDQRNALMQFGGLFYSGPEMILSSRFHLNSTPQAFGRVSPAYHLLTQRDLQNGVEMSTSRGCPRACGFCSHIHGGKVRQLDPVDFENHLEKLHARLKDVYGVGPIPESARAVNLNDDDILLNPELFIRKLELIQAFQLKIWGVQTSAGALHSRRVRNRVLPLLADASLYPGGRPIMWIGTDAFHAQRLVRLGKSGTLKTIGNICRDLDRYGILGCHYWIVTDAESNWEQLLHELFFLDGMVSQYPETFRVLPNAGTLVPYPSTMIFRKRVQNGLTDRLVLRQRLLFNGYPEFSYPLIRHERPESDYLYALVEPQAGIPESLLVDARGFIADIRKSKFISAVGRCVGAMRLEQDACMARDEKENLGKLITWVREKMFRNPKNADYS